MSARSDHKAALHPRPAVLVWGTVNPHFLVEEPNQEGTLGGGEPHSPTDAIEMLDLGGMKAQPFGLQAIPEGLGSVPHLGGDMGCPQRSVWVQRHSNRAAPLLGPTLRGGRAAPKVLGSPPQHSR